MKEKDSTIRVQKIPDFIEKRLFEEYRELGLSWRHDSESFSKLTAVLLPLSIAALTLPYLKAGASKLLVTVGGLMLMTFWFFSSLSYENRSYIRWSRVHEIERILGFDSHLRIKRDRAKSVLKVQGLRSWMFGLYLAIAFFVTCYIKVESGNFRIEPDIRKFGATLGSVDVLTTPDLWISDEWIVKLSITVETLVYLIIAAAVVRIWVWICKRDGKRPNSENKA